MKFYTVRGKNYFYYTNFDDKKFFSVIYVWSFMYNRIIVYAIARKNYQQKFCFVCNILIFMYVWIMCVCMYKLLCVYVCTSFLNVLFWEFLGNKHLISTYKTCKWNCNSNWNLNWNWNDININKIFILNKCIHTYRYTKYKHL